MLASLNLKAGKRAVALADFNAAFGFFKHGVLFLPNDCWDVNYDLSIQLFDLATEAGKHAPYNIYTWVLLHDLSHK